MKSADLRHAIVGWSGYTPVRLILFGLALSVVHTTGLFRSADRAILGAGVAQTGRPDTTQAPLLVAIDEATLALAGELPWTADQWNALAAALKRAGIEEAFLVEPPAAVLASSPAANAPVPAKGATPVKNEEPMALIHVPVLVGARPGERIAPAVSRLEKPTGALMPWDKSVFLPPHSDGVIRDLTAAANTAPVDEESAFCVWNARCPSGGDMSLPLVPFGAGGSLPTISAANLLDGKMALDPVLSKGTVLIGVTAPWLSRQTRIGSSAVLVSQPEAIGIAIASARSRPPVHVPGRAVDTLIILLAVFGAWALHRLRGFTRDWVFVHAIPPLFALIAIALYCGGILRVPVVALALAPLVPIVVAALATGEMLSEFLQNIARVVVREGFRYSPRAAIIRTKEDLIVKLGGLTRNYTRTDRLAWFHADAVTGRIDFEGGYGITRADLGTYETTITGAPWSLLADSPGGMAVGNLFKDPDLRAYLVPLYVEGALLGVWVVPFTETTGAPDPRIIGELVRWLTPRLAFTGPDLSRMKQARAFLADRLKAELASVKDLLVAASEERRQQLETLRAVGFPLMVADVSGAVLYVNTELKEVLTRAGIGSLSSVREFAFRLWGEAELKTVLSRLFGEHASVSFPWVDGDGRHHQVRLDAIRSEDEQRDLLGYVAVFQDTSPVERLRKTRTMLAGHLAVSTVEKIAAIREAALDGGAKALGTIPTDLETVEQLVLELRAVVDKAERLDRPMPVDFGDVVRSALRNLAGLRRRRRQEVTCKFPDGAQSVMTIASRAEEQLVALLREACVRAPEGAELSVNVRNEKDKTTVSIGWPGVGFDERLLESWRASPAAEGGETAMPEAFAGARRVFGELTFGGAPGSGASVTFSLPRA